MQEVGPVELTAVAHGGWTVGRLDGRVVFVRGGIPGELVMVELTDATKKNFWRAEVSEVLLASPHRVGPPCPVAGECGGCDFQHVSVTAQLDLKRQVVAEQLKRLADIDWVGTVDSVGEELGWRTRMRYHRDGDTIGLRAARSHRVIALPPGGCLIAHPAGRQRVMDAGGEDLNVTVAVSGVAVNSRPATVTENVLGRSFSVAAGGFWQIHPLAAETLVTTVLNGLDVRSGDSALDLYCGAGLFSRFLVDAGARVTGVEGNRIAVNHARVNVPEARFHCGDVAATLSRLRPVADLVVLDPPRSGAGREVVSAVAQSGPGRIAYVACDPASLARDLKTFQQLGYQVDSIRAFDLFPMTHHVETCVFLSRKDS